MFISGTGRVCALGRLRRGPGHREAHPEDRVRAQALLVLAAVGLDEHGVDDALVVGGQALHGRPELVEDGLDRLLHALAAVAGRVAVAQLVGLEGAGGGAGGNRGPGGRAVVQADLDLDGGVAAGVQDLAGDDGFDDGHGALL